MTALNVSGVKLGLALTGSHCTIPSVWPVVEQLLARGVEIFPILSPSVAHTDTRFGRADEVKVRLAELCGREPWSDLVSVETIGSRKLLDILAVAPCTGNTLAKLANGISDTAVTLACKAHLRNERPVVLAISTNDGLSGNARNLAVLLGRRHFFFVPFGQDSPDTKVCSLVAKLTLLPATIEAALEGRQLEPILVCG